MGLDSRPELRCLHQVFRGESQVNISSFFGENGRGDCRVCKYDPGNNGHCSAYTPVLVYFVEIMGDRKEVSTPPPGFEPGSRP